MFTLMHTNPESRVQSPEFRPNTELNIFYLLSKRVFQKKLAVSHVCYGGVRSPHLINSLFLYASNIPSLTMYNFCSVSDSFSII